MSRLCACLALLAGTATAVRAQDPYVAPGAPQDRMIELPTDAEERRLDSAIAPYVAQARETYPDARDRFLLGLPPRHGFLRVRPDLERDPGRRGLPAAGSLRRG